MQGLIIPLAAGTLGCSASIPAHTRERAAGPVPTSDSIRSSPAAVDLTGGWATGSTGEPDVRRIELRPECNHHPAVWLLEQRGDTIHAWAIPASRTQGVTSAQPASAAAAEGRVSGVDLTLRMAGASYVLRYDSTSGHLRGTLDGAPFWAVRQDIVRPQGCIPPPEQWQESGSAGAAATRQQSVRLNARASPRTPFRIGTSHGRCCR